MKSTILAFALSALCASSAMANTYDVQLHQSKTNPHQWTGSFNLSQPTPWEGQYFSDTYNFTPDLPGALTVNGGVVNFFGFDEQKIRFSHVFLNETELALSNGDGESKARLTNVVLSGPLSLRVTGWTGDSASYSGNFNITTAVPEPATYGMLMGGLALVGVAARRRKAK
ncbi:MULTISPECIES: FxDxF family PEP-CTERM protein [unclassified Duganella]|uniref:FxDxF family PEP-CTERM protein n=1 Tax=unclassified Duganella TaxID=2636909 RepID=UPI0018F5747E|nr:MULTISPECIES: FxDxF family PEP-CTERM protein [unclassified Duganella]